jgi:predicted AlkP superfamily phosphohydrolase/phosphomutase/tetratricopeptide (TPR) repeat protein
LLIGWDAADWKILSPLLDAGKMPALAGLIERGVVGNIATLTPALSPILWTSIATGKRADKHGILGFIEPIPEQNGVRQVCSTSRKTKALWNILTQSGLKTHVVGWYASHPAEPINGICISNLFSDAVAPLGADWPMPAGAVHPASLAESVAALRVHPGEIGDADLRPFIPKLAEVDRSKDKRPAKLAALLATTASVQAAATAILEAEEWDFLGVYFDGIDTASHDFMPYFPPRMAHVNERDFALYRDVMEGVYRFHDMMLARMMALAGDDATIIVLSDHGFHSDHLRPTGAAAQMAGMGAMWHRQYGVLAMAGPGICRDERIYGATLLDIAPTVLALFDLPTAEDFDGKPLLSAFDEPPHLQRIPSWDSVAGEAGLHPPDVRVDPYTSSAALTQLVELGYLEPPTADQQHDAALARRESQFNLGVILLDSERAAAALPILESLYREKPDTARYGSALSSCHLALRRFDDCRATIDQMTSRGLDSISGQVMLGECLVAEGHFADALEQLRRALDAQPHTPRLRCMIGLALTKLSRWSEATVAFEGALQIDPDSAMAHYGLAITHLGERRFEEAAGHALRAVSLLYFFPAAHFTLGVALARLKRFEQAARSIEIALSMQPGLLDAHRYLGAIHARLGDYAKAHAHRQTARRLWDELASRRGSPTSSDH